MKKTTILFGLFIFFSSLITAQENKIIDIKIKGLKKTKISVIEAFLLIKKDAVLDSTILSNDIQRLKRLPLVSNAYFQVHKENNNNFSVVFIVEENHTIIPSVNFWTTTSKEFAYKIGLVEHNLFGRNMSFGGFYQNNGYHSYGINFRAPYLFSNRLGLAVSKMSTESHKELIVLSL